MIKRKMEPHERAAHMADSETRLLEVAFFHGEEYQNAIGLQMAYPQCHVSTPFFDYFKTWLCIYDAALKELVWEPV